MRPRDLIKFAASDHVTQRAKERTDLSDTELRKARQAVKHLTLRPAQTYHYKFPGRGYIVYGSVGKKKPEHVAMTVLSPSMKPPGISIDPVDMRRAMDKVAQPVMPTEEQLEAFYQSQFGEAAHGVYERLDVPEERENLIRRWRYRNDPVFREEFRASIPPDPPELLEAAERIRGKTAAKTPEGYRRKAVVIPYTEDGKVLVNTPPGEPYGFPGGGVDPGESYRRAARREALEEAGVRVGRPKVLVPRHLANRSTHERKVDNPRGPKGNDYAIYMAKVKKEDKKLYGIEGDQMEHMKYVTPDEAIAKIKPWAKHDPIWGAEEVFQANIEALERFKKRQK